MSKVQEIDSSRKQLASDLSNIRSTFGEKVDSKDIRLLERKVQDCAPWEAVRNIYKELSFYLKKDDFDLFKTESFLHWREVADKIEPLITKAQVASDLGNLKLQVYSDLEKYSRIKDCHADKLETVKMFQKAREEANEIKKTCIKLDNDIASIKRHMNTKADDSEL